MTKDFASERLFLLMSTQCSSRTPRASTRRPGSSPRRSPHPISVDLTKQGFDPWLDAQRIAGGATWTKEIEHALDDAECRRYYDHLAVSTRIPSRIGLLLTLLVSQRHYRIDLGGAPRRNVTGQAGDHCQCQRNR